MNSATPRVFIAATRQNDGKTTVSLGLIAALQQRYPRVGYIKPVGQRFVEIAEQKIDEDILLMDFASATQALVKVRVRINTIVFVDYLTYHQVDGDWLITAKGYHVERTLAA